MNKGIENLKPVLSKEEAIRRGRQGGIKSGEARRQRKTLKEALKLALELKKDGVTIQDKGVIALLEKYMDGDLKAFEIVRDTIGEKPTDKIEADVNQDISINIELSED
jgi:isocitrate dehydrogenase